MRNTHVEQQKRLRYKDATLEAEERQIHLTETSPEIQTLVL